MKIKYFIVIILVGIFYCSKEEIVYRDFKQNGRLEALIDDFSDEVYLVQLDLLNDSLINHTLNIFPNLELFVGPSSYHRLINYSDFIILQNNLSEEYYKVLNDNYQFHTTREYWTETLAGSQFSSSSGETSSSCMCIDGPDCVVIGFNDSWYNPFDYYGEASWNFSPPPNDQIVEARVYVSGSQCDNLPLYSETNLSVKNNSCNWSDFQVTLSADNTINGPYIISDDILDQIWCNGFLAPVIGSEDNYNVDWVQIELYYSCETPDNNSNLIASDDEFCNYVEINWENDDTVLGYNLYKDGSFLSSFDNNQNQFIDYQANVDIDYEYCLTSFNDCGESEYLCNYGSRKSNPPSSNNVIASNNSVNQIFISWIPSEETSSYNLYRDGFLLSVMPNNLFEYTDIFVESDIMYEYCIESVNECGSSNWICDTGSLAIGSIGDVNLDEVVDILDVINILNFVLEQSVPSDDEFWLSDINTDGFVNILDLVQLVNIILG